MTEPAPAAGGPRDRHSDDDQGVWSAATHPSGEPTGVQADPETDAGSPVMNKTPSGEPVARETPAAQWPPSGRPGIVDAPALRPGPRDERSAPQRNGLQRGGRQGGGLQRNGTQRGRTQRGGESPGGDLMSGVQRWLIRSSAKSMRRELEGQVKRTLGGGRAGSQDVWGTATTEPPPDLDQAPECAWCPVCRAARRMRETGPGRGQGLMGVSDAVAAAVQDALGAFEGVLSRTAAPPGGAAPADRSAGSPDADSAASDAERADHEPGDRR